jgi:hypothetical protein
MRFHGAVGYADSQETSPGVWEEVITEIEYFGSVTRAQRRLEGPSLTVPVLNENLAVDNSFSILADAYAYENFEKMRYVSWNGSNWRITNVEVRRPRLILMIGALWNGATPSAAGHS